MLRRIAVVIFVVAVVALGLKWVLGGHTRAVVATARQQLRERVVEAIGRHAIQRKAITLKIQDAREALTTAAAESAKAQALAKLSGRRQATAQAQLGKVERELAYVAKRLVEGESLCIDGRTIPIDRLKQIARRLRTQREGLTSAVKAHGEAGERADDAVRQIRQTIDDSRAAIMIFEARLQKVDAKLHELRALEAQLDTQTDPIGIVARLTAIDRDLTTFETELEEQVETIKARVDAIGAIDPVEPLVEPLQKGSQLGAEILRELGIEDTEGGEL